MLMDWIWLSVLFLALILVIGFAEIVRKKIHWQIRVTRKFVHILTGIFIASTPFLLQSQYPLLVLSGIFIFANFVAIKKEWMPGMHDRTNQLWHCILSDIVFYPPSNALGKLQVDTRDLDVNYGYCRCSRGNSR